jgi:hypothetical protein
LGRGGATRQHLAEIASLRKYLRNVIGNRRHARSTGAQIEQVLNPAARKLDASAA